MLPKINGLKHKERIMRRVAIGGRVTLISDVHLAVKVEQIRI